MPIDRIDNYLKSLVFRDGHLPPSAPSVFIEVRCTCGAIYGTKVRLIDSRPVSDEAIKESKATCHVCSNALKEAELVVMYAGQAAAVKYVKGYI